MKVLTRIGDRLTERLAPRATARADECEYDYKCVHTADCPYEPFGHTYLRRLVCAGAGIGDWRIYGCCP